MNRQPDPGAQGDLGRAKPRRSHLSDREREAVRLSDELRGRMAAWLSYRGVTGRPGVSPYVDPSGQPAVVITMNAYLARAMLLSFEEQRTQRH